MAIVDMREIPDMAGLIDSYVRFHDDRRWTDVPVGNDGPVTPDGWFIPPADWAANRLVAGLERTLQRFAGLPITQATIAEVGHVAEAYVYSIDPGLRFRALVNTDEAQRSRLSVAFGGRDGRVMSIEDIAQMVVSRGHRDFGSGAVSGRRQRHDDLW